MKREDLEEWLDTKWLGRNLQMMEETDSTNQRAKTAAATGEQEGLTNVPLWIVGSYFRPWLASDYEPDGGADLGPLPNTDDKG